jgi:hypothetical protein
MRKLERLEAMAKKRVGAKSVGRRPLFATADMRLVFLPVNQRYVFTFGRDGNPTTLAEEDRFFATKADALAAARRKGLTVGKNGIVSVA